MDAALQVGNLLSQGDCLLQPFLSPVTATTPAPVSASVPSEVDAVAATTAPVSKWGEVCIILVDGVIVHAVHKNPTLWGWHKDTCPCSGSLLALEAAVCTCDGAVGRHGGVDATVRPRDSCCNFTQYEGLLPSECVSAFKRAPVEALVLPLPESMVAVTRAVLAALPGYRASDG